MVNELLSVLMDGIKDTEMLVEWARIARERGEENTRQFFVNHALKRYDGIVSDYEFIKREIGIDERISDGDAIADALNAHIIYQMRELKRRME